MEKTHTLTLTRHEAMMLLDHLPPPQGEGEDAEEQAALAIKLGCVFLDGEKGVAPPMAVSPFELWLIRGVLNSQWRVGSESIGLSLMEKVYTVLRSMSNEEDGSDEAVALLGETADDVDELPKRNKRLGLWKEKGGKRHARSTRQNADPHAA